MTKWLVIALCLVLLAAFSLAFIVTRIENAQAAKNTERLSNSLSSQAATPYSGASVAVVVFSRSGNTGVLANHIARLEQADVYEITATDYALGIPGWISALKDARSNVAAISPAVIDLAQYKKVYLGSPIWLYSPAPPIWQFVKSNDFQHKEVVLFNTFNSKFEQHFIDDFAALVKAKGAGSFAHKYVKRGRMGDQISTEQMLSEFDKQ